MLLRESSRTSDVNLNAAVNSGVESGVPHGATLLAFADAVLGDDDAALDAARSKILQELGPKALIDSAGVVATFMQMDRIADGTGIPLDSPFVEQTGDMRAELGLNSFASAQNTLGAST